MGVALRFREIEDLVGLVHLASQRGDANDVIASLTGVQKAELAIACYARAHTRETALLIAATCDEQTLVETGAGVGQVLFKLSRRHSVDSAPVVRKRPITLATPQPKLQPFVDADPDEEVVAEVAA